MSHNMKSKFFFLLSGKMLIHEYKSFKMPWQLHAPRDNLSGQCHKYGFILISSFCNMQVMHIPIFSQVFVLCEKYSVQTGMFQFIFYLHGESEICESEKILNVESLQL